jgi:hypothetical protein
LNDVIIVSTYVRVEVLHADTKKNDGPFGFGFIAESVTDLSNERWARDGVQRDDGAGQLGVSVRPREDLDLETCIIYFQLRSFARVFHPTKEQD